MSIRKTFRCVPGNDRVREARGRSVIGSRTPHVVYGRIYEIPAHIAACGNC
ncbi:hypothetical protein BALAC2494_00712 [Bifidobacterium animalis subsp. lactis CNCM I-2494]|uniref:Uncharacterized protein n=1 Tax=Bifidobacterium animalis subsp. lactis CNCM I-2494 TaxID=1042403 RepID=A0A806FHZ7_BIFAN|nr:hypothetical protein BALAC2494_00712 [Bifidobacterium animalis subsp. lactis CNCM I-2494]